MPGAAPGPVNANCLAMVSCSCSERPKLRKLRNWLKNAADTWPAPPGHAASAKRALVWNGEREGAGGTAGGRVEPSCGRFHHISALCRGHRPQPCQQVAAICPHPRLAAV